MLYCVGVFVQKRDFRGALTPLLTPVGWRDNHLCDIAHYASLTNLTAF